MPKWIYKTLDIYTIEYQSDIKRNQVLLHATCMNLKNFVLNERNQTQKVICSMTAFILNTPEETNLYRVVEWLPRAWGGNKRDY